MAKRRTAFGNCIKYAKESGAKESKIILAKSVVTAEWVRMKCRFGCDGYGRCLMCPPSSPTPEETRQVVRHYTYALLVRGDAYTDLHAMIPVLERRIFLDGYFKALGLGAGPCQLCKRCARLCRHPDKTRPSMEACGIDVFTTVRSNGFPITVLPAPGCKGNYYGIVFIE